jgi:transposase-like protein
MLEGAYPYLWLDAKHAKVHDHGRAVSKALVVVNAVHETGLREVIGLDIGEVESGSFWWSSPQPREAPARRVRVAISQISMKGSSHAVARVLGCPWQHSTVHFVRDVLAHRRRGQRGAARAVH